MIRRLTLVLLFFVGLEIAIPEVPVLRIVLEPVVGISEVQAQTKKRKRKSLFDVLFKRRKKKKNRIRVNRSRKENRSDRRTTRKKNRRATVTASRKNRRSNNTPAVIVVKNENAAKILVVGDFLGGGVAKGLKKIYESNPNVVVINKSNPSSGLVRNDVIDWPQTVPSLIDEFKPAAIVALVGMNDRQEMRLAGTGGRVQKLGPEWVTEYNNRANQLASVGINNKIPLVWMGLPPVRSTRMNADYLAFNEIYRTRIEATGSGEFVDVWDGFTNAEGKFVSAGPDINGQIVRLRGAKGINMTRAGNAKLGFFADKALRKIGVVGNQEGFEYASFGITNPGVIQPAIPQYDPATSGKTLIIPLGSPSLDGGITLEGDKDFLTSKESAKSVSYELVEKGLVHVSQPGRIDAAWGQPNIKKPEEADKADGKDEKNKTSKLGITESLKLLPTSPAAPVITNIQPATVSQ